MIKHKINKYKLSWMLIEKHGKYKFMIIGSFILTNYQGFYHQDKNIAKVLHEFVDV